jgi:hypothetical protein
MARRLKLDTWRAGGLPTLWHKPFWGRRGAWRLPAAYAANTGQHAGSVDRRLHRRLGNVRLIESHRAGYRAERTADG